jgi:hypothetical protein
MIHSFVLKCKRESSTLNCHQNRETETMNKSTDCTMATARPQVNPFYIEPAAQEWNGDYDWQHDEDDVEHEGLLDSTNNNLDDSGVRQRLRRDRRSQRQQHSPYRFRFLVGFGLVFILFIAALTLMVDNSKATQGNLDKVDDVEDDDPQQQVQQIVILGERVSGVPWLKEQLQGMYPNITVTTKLQREGTWFQGPPDKRTPRTLLFAVFRNPYDWVEQMRLYPRFMPAHMGQNGLSLPWRPFVEKEWAIERPQWDQPPLATEACQLGFSYDQVITCRVTDASNDRLNPIYELQKGGTPFQNILALRAAKIKHIFHDIPQLFQASLVTDPIAIRYETVNLPAYLKATPLLAPLFDYLDTELDATFTASPAPVADHENITMEYIEWMNENVNWTAETWLGYQALQDDKGPNE